VREAFGQKATTLALGSWTTMVSTVEGRDKMMKVIQFSSRFMAWHCAARDPAAARRWTGLFKSSQEGRKSIRVLKALNKVDQLFDEVPALSTPYEKALVVAQQAGLAGHWHFDYLGHAHRAGFAERSHRELERIRRIPAFCWCVCNVAQILRGELALRNAAAEITRVRRDLEALGPRDGAGEADAQREARVTALEEELRALRVQRFNGWVLLFKGVADMACAGNMPGPELRRRFPATFGWMNDGVVGAAGVFSALCVCFNHFPSSGASVGGRQTEWQSNQTQRNAVGLAYGLVQLSALVGASRAAPGGAEAKAQ